jgi:lipopolysaccharide export system protein LptC
MSAIAESHDRRARLYRSLARRNSFVGVLRIGVPAIGLLVLAGLLAQIYLTSLSRQYGIGSISLDRSKITVDTPQYSGVMSNGASYKMIASGAVAAMDRQDVISLINATLTMDNPDGTQTIAKAPLADLQTTSEQVTVAGIMHVTMSTGLTGTLHGSFIDWPTQRLVASGPVHFDFGDGSALDAASMDYTAGDGVYIFTNVNLDQPYLPQSAQPESVQPESTQ